MVNTATPTNWQFNGSSWWLDGVWVSRALLKFSTPMSTDCFYQLAPTTIVGPSRLRGRKKRKESANFLACADYTGTDRRPQLVLGKSRNPRCFENRDLASGGLRYCYSAKGWTTTELFYEWLVWFDGYIGKTTRRWAILLIDNAPCRGQASTIPNKLKLKFYFFPKNTTSSIQPLEAGVIFCIKKRFMRTQLKGAIHLIEKGVHHRLYSLDLYTAMTITDKIWKEIDYKIVNNWWRTADLFQHIQL